MPNVDHSAETHPSGAAPALWSQAAHRPPRQPSTDQAPALDQLFTVDDLFSLRSAVAAHATELGAAAVDDMVLVAHELASNAVRHGGGSGRLRLWRSGDHLYCEVRDNGSGLPEPDKAGTRPPSPSVPGGRGLWIARKMAEVEIRSTSGGTTITAVFTAR
jgi:anti-sigma regulatory factor (Ser/Thr protein kinase)